VAKAAELVDAIDFVLDVEPSSVIDVDQADYDTRGSTSST
jgi:hypothetical protein